VDRPGAPEAAAALVLRSADPARSLPAGVVSRVAS
jgi:hypothetical protein